MLGLVAHYSVLGYMSTRVRGQKQKRKMLLILDASSSVYHRTPQQWQTAITDPVRINWGSAYDNEAQLLCVIKWGSGSGEGRRQLKSSGWQVRQVP